MDAYDNVTNKVDLMSIHMMMEDPGYIWANFIKDLACIVNNALEVFPAVRNLFTFLVTIRQGRI